MKWRTLAKRPAVRAVALLLVGALAAGGLLPDAVRDALLAGLVPVA